MIKIMMKLSLSLFIAILFTLAFGNSIIYAKSIAENQYIMTTDGKVSLEEIDKYRNVRYAVDESEIEALLKEIDFNINNTNEKLLTSNLLSTLAASSPYGAAWPYTYVGSTNINCYGYASRFSRFLNPGDISYTPNSPIGNGATPGVSTVANYVLSDLGRAGRNSRLISSSTSFVNFNEYRIALRTGNQYGIYDYHFMFQTNIGGWCEKHGSQPSIYDGYINPSTFRWDLGSLKGFYNSNTVYLAVKR